MVFKKDLNATSYVDGNVEFQITSSEECSQLDTMSKESQIPLKDKCATSQEQVDDHVGPNNSKTWEEAAIELKTSRRPGKVVSTSDGFVVQYHDHWRKEHEDMKKAKAQEQLLRFQLAKQEEEERKEKARLNLIRKRQKEQEQQNRLALEEKAHKLELQKQAEWELRKRKDEQQAMQRRVKELIGENVILIAQYRHPGSSSDNLSEWGIWVVIDNGIFSIYHESQDRITYAKKERIVIKNSRKEAIDYCNYLVSVGWYRDTRLFTPDESTSDFPTPPLPTQKERNEARSKFRRWKDIVQEEDRSENCPF